MERARVRGKTLHIVSYSYPPDSDPASHRPYELACLLEARGRPFRLFTRHGVSTKARLDVKETPHSRFLRIKTGMKRFLRCFAFLFQADRATSWGLKILPRLWWELLRARWREGGAALVFTSSPYCTNLYVASVASFFAGARLHFDAHDAIDGVHPSLPMPLLTRFALWNCASLWAVTEPLVDMLRSRCPRIEARLAYNGVSEAAVARSLPEWHEPEAWITVTYGGALYGGLRPYGKAIDVLRAASELLAPSFAGIELTLVGREDLSFLEGRHDGPRFRLKLLKECGKDEILERSARSAVNLILVGAPFYHRTAVPLKCFDLLGVGRPILHVGPADGEGLAFLRPRCLAGLQAVDPGAEEVDDVEALARWLEEAARTPSRPCREPSSRGEVEKLIGCLFDEARAPSQV